MRITNRKTNQSINPQSQAPKGGLTMKLTKTLDMQFADGIYPVTFSLERQDSLDKSKCRYRFNAITATGFDLTQSSYGLFGRSYFDANKRLRSTKSIKQEMETLLNDLTDERTLSMGKRFIVKSLTVKKKLESSEWQFFKECDPFPTCSIKSKESGNPISWYYHDVFNTSSEIEITFSRKESNQLTAHASEADLYDLSKLARLADGERFKNNNYAFFFYNEVNRLLGREFDGEVQQMSGFFK